jgi:hypothetical protein
MVYNNIVAANTDGITIAGIYIVSWATAYITNNHMLGLVWPAIVMYGLVIRSLLLRNADIT